MGQRLVPAIDHRQPPGGGGGVGLDHQPLGRKARLRGQAAAPEQLRRHGRDAMRLRNQLGEIFIVRHAAQDRAGAHMRHVAPTQQQRREHLAILKPAAIEQRDHEIDIGPIEQRFIAVGDPHLEADRFQRRSHLMMIEGVIAIDRIRLAGCAGMFGEEKQAQPSLVGRGDANATVDMGQHGPVFSRLP